MLKIQNIKIESKGNFHEQVTDYMMLSEYIFQQIADELGEDAAKRFFKHELHKMLENVRERRGTGCLQ